jgi:hypothetical protein
MGVSGAGVYAQGSRKYRAVRMFGEHRLELAAIRQRIMPGILVA